MPTPYPALLFPAPFAATLFSQFFMASSAVLPHVFVVFLNHGIVSRGCVPDAQPVALVTEKVSENVQDALAAAGWGVMSVDTITSMHPNVVEDRWRDNYSKLHMFALQEYDVVMFIDADAVVLGDLQADIPL